MSMRDDTVSMRDMLSHAREAVELLAGTGRGARAVPEDLPERFLDLGQGRDCRWSDYLVARAAWAVSAGFGVPGKGATANPAFGAVG